MRRAQTIIILILILVITACAGAAETQTPPPSSMPPTANAPSVTATPEAQPTGEASPVPSDTTVPATDPPSVTETATLSPIRATQQALADAVRLPTPVASSVPIADDDYVALTDQACRIVQENYVRDDFNGVDWPATCEEYRVRAAEVESQQEFWDLMSSFIGELNDEHSRFVPPGRFSAEFSLPSEGAGRPWPGLSVWPAREDERLLIWNVCQTGPAAEAGLQRGDEILAIDGEPIPQDVGRAEVNAALYAEDKSEVTLTVQQGPDADPREIDISYGGASGCDGWSYGLLSEGPRIGYIRIPSFAGDAATNILGAIQLLEEDGPLDGLILDVRHNPGGNSDQSIAIFTTGTFGKTGPLRDDALQSIYRIRGPVSWNETTPVALLIDGASHSAAEYFATAMQQSARATLVGMPTAGNTEGINSFNLADGSLIRLAWTTLQLPDGSTLEGTGVQPDIRVPLGEWGLRERPDVQLQAAFNALVEP